MADSKLLLVTGATGYVGGRLVPLLLASGYRVRVLVRDIARLQGRPWLERVEVLPGDALKSETLPQAMSGVDVAYYLIHSICSGADFHQRDLVAARNFANAAQAAGVRRIIYLGGMGNPDAKLSEHLSSRQQTGAALREVGVPVTEFRAAIIVGSGSVSFEIIRYLTERIPIMVCPCWVFNKVQPIAIRNVLEYLIAALETPQSAGQIIEIGGADVLTYGDMMLQYAHVRGLRRWLLPLPLLTPRLSAYWVHWVTPIPAGIAHPLIEGLRNEVIIREHKARRLFPNIQPIDYQTAVQEALVKVDMGQIETTWCDALVTSQGDTAPVCLTSKEGVIIEQRQQIVSATPAKVYHTVLCLGGQYGWPYLNWVWRLRGILDRVVGGVGLRRGRRSAYELRVGDAVDFWRVESLKPKRLLRLRAEMKLPGQAWLQFEGQPLDEGQTRLIQTAFFAPKGLSGLLYWYLLYPTHRLIFAGMIKKLAQKAEGCDTQHKK